MRTVNGPYKQRGPRGKREHVWIAEQALGRELPDGAEVHHVNEIKRDNRNCNLVICENCDYHRLLHKRKRAVEAGYPATWISCPFCKKFDAPEVFGEFKPRQQRHKECAAQYDRVRRTSFKETR